MKRSVLVSSNNSPSYKTCSNITWNLCIVYIMPFQVIIKLYYIIYKFKYEHKTAIEIYIYTQNFHFQVAKIC